MNIIAMNDRSGIPGRIERSLMIPLPAVNPLSPKAWSVDVVLWGIAELVIGVGVGVGLQAAIGNRIPRPRRAVKMTKGRGVKFIVSRICALISSLVGLGLWREVSVVMVETENVSWKENQVLVLYLSYQEMTPWKTITIHEVQASMTYARYYSQHPT